MATHAQTATSVNSESGLEQGEVASTETSIFHAPVLWDRFAQFIKYSNTVQDLPTTHKQSTGWAFTAITIRVLLMLTLLGGVVGVFRVIYSSATIYYLTRSSVLLDDPVIRAEVSHILAQLPKTRMTANITVRKIRNLGTPFVSWLTGNKIYVPDGFLQWSAMERSASLAHEISHLSRRDHFGRLVIQLAHSFLWLHPMVWVLLRQSVLAQELAADQLAAQCTESTTAYCRGLSRLALRFDAECRRPSAVGVFVSSSLIRRITMLRKNTFHRLPCSRFVNRLVTSFAFVACSWIGCWSVTAQTSTQENQSRVVKASHASPVTMFSQPTTKPWNTIGNQPGYVSVQASRILNHPEFQLYQPVLTRAFDSIMRSSSDQKIMSKHFGLEINNIELIEGGLKLIFQHNHDAEDGHRSQLSLGASTIEIRSASPVDWGGLIRAIDADKLESVAQLETIDLDAVQQAWADSARKGRSNIFPIETLLNERAPKWDEPSETKKMLWDAVSGGAATAVYDILQAVDVPEDYREKDAFNQANLEMTLATQTAAWGVDLTPDYKNCQIRFAAVPKAGVSVVQLQEKFEAVKAAMLNTDADDEFSLHLVEQLKKASVSVVKCRGENGKEIPSFLLVEAECSADFGKYRLIKNVSAKRPTQAKTGSE